MFLQFIKEYSDYNLWANELLARRLASLTEEQLMREIKSSFPSIRKTVVHILSVEDVWLQRLRDIKPANFLPDNPELSTSEQINKWLKGSDMLKEYASGLSEEDLRRVHTGYNSQGKPYSDLEWQMLSHCFDHSSYHRGQIVTMLRQLDITTGIPNTGMMAYYRR